jgi:hypothetical protein
MGQASRSAFGESSRANRIGPGGHTPSFAGDLSLQGESDRNLSAQGWPGCPLWVKSGLSSQHQSMTALPPKADISAMGWAGRFMSTRSRPCTHKSRLVSSGWSLSALPPKADIRQRIEHVCFVPLADFALTSYLRNTADRRHKGANLSHCRHGSRRNHATLRVQRIPVV